MKPNQLIHPILIFSLFFIIGLSKTFAQAELTTFSIQPSKLEGKAGDTITYRINTKKFKNVLGFDFTITWDSTMFKVASKYDEIKQSINSNLINMGYNILSNRFIVTYISEDYIYGDSLSMNDSTLVSFKLILKKDGDSQNLCFSKMYNLELSYFDLDENNYATTSNFIFDCNRIVMLVPKVQISRIYYNIIAYDTLDLVKLKAKVSYGVKPYKHHWGGNFNEELDSIFIQNPLRDTIYNYYVTDALNDTSYYTFYIYYYLTNYNLSVNINSLEFNYYNPTLKFEPLIKGGTPPYKYLWNTDKTIKTDTNFLEINNPNKDFYYKVYVTDAKQNKGYGNIYGKISKMSLTTPNDLKKVVYFVDDTINNIIATVSSWFKPVKYFWSDGTESTFNNYSYKTIKRPEKDSTWFSATVVDKDGNELKDSILQIFNNVPFLTISSIDTLGFNNTVYINFNSNPRNGPVEWRYEFKNEYQTFTKSGVCNSSLQLPFNDFKGQFGEVKFYYKLAGIDASIVPEQFVKFRVKNSNYYLQFSNFQKDYYVCEKNKKVVVKATAYSSSQNDILFYDWGIYGKGYNLDSISVYLDKTTTINLNVYGILNTKASNQIKVHVGEMDSYKIVSFPDHICKDGFINIENVKILNYQLSHYNKDFKCYSTYTRQTNGGISLYNDNHSPINVEYLVVKIDQTNTGLCLENNYQPYVDTILLYPSPKYINQLICATNTDSSIEFNLNEHLDPLNLTSYKLIDIKSNYYYTNGSNKRINIKNGVESANSTIFFPKDTIGLNNEKFYTAIDLNIRSKYEDYGCVTDEIVRINVTEKLKMIMSPKYQTIKSGETIDTFFHKIDNIYNVNLGIWEATAFILNYNGNLSNSLLKYNVFSTYKVGQLYNSFNYPIVAKFIIFAHYMGCPIDPDTAYITVNPLNPLFQSDYTLSETNEISQGKVKIIKDDLDQPIDFEYYPNPTQQFLNIQYTIENPEETELLIYDRTGKLLEGYKLSLNSGKNQFQIDTKKLAPDSYILHLRNREHTKTLQFVKN